MSNKIKTFVFTAFITIMVICSLFEFCVGISEAIFLSRYHQFNDACRDIWNWILAACIINISGPVFTGCGINTALKVLFDDGDKEAESVGLQIVHIVYIVVMIWSTVTYYEINNSCRDFWVSNAPELWTFVMIHFVMFWINVAIFACGILMACCYCALVLAVSMEEESSNSKSGYNVNVNKDKKNLDMHGISA